MAIVDTNNLAKSLTELTTGQILNIWDPDEADPQKMKQMLIENFVGQLLAADDVIINGRFDFWQEATSQTTSGYGSDDLWINNHSGSSKTHSQQAFTLGQTDVPGNPKYFSRTVVTSSAGASNFVAKQQRFEDVTKFSGKTVNFTIWAKADAAKNVAIEFSQYFGTGGSPSATVTGIGVTTLALTTSWQRFVVPVTFPSVSAKTLGTNGNDYSNMAIWFDAGSSFDSRTNTLGQQSGTFDLANCRGIIGNFPISDIHWRPYQKELDMISRFWEAGEMYAQFYAASAACVLGQYIQFAAKKRTSTITVTPTHSSGNNMDATPTVVFSSASGFGLKELSTASGNAWWHCTYTADARL